MATKSKAKPKLNGNEQRRKAGLPPRGRPHKTNTDRMQVTCVLNKDTVQRLREGAASRHFGEFLQAHLDRYPPPTREQFLSLRDSVPYYTLIKGRKVPTIMASGLGREARLIAKARAR